MARLFVELQQQRRLDQQPPDQAQGHHFECRQGRHLGETPNGAVYHFDPTDTNNGANPLPIFAYSQPVKYKAGTIDSPPDGTLTGDAAQSWELSATVYQLTFKLRPNVKLDPRAPTNGRELRLRRLGLQLEEVRRSSAPQAGELSAEKAKGAPILRWENPDKNTVVMKMAYPYAPLIGSLADARIAFVLIPVESADKFDMHKDTRGSGAFMLQNYVPDQRIEWVRNPNYWDTPPALTSTASPST